MYRNMLWKLLLLGLLALLPLLSKSPATAAPDRSPGVMAKGFLSRPSKHTPVWIAYTYLSDNRKRLGLRYPRTDMVVTEVDDDHRERHYVHLQRLLFQTPVWGDRLVVEIDEEGVIRQVSGTVHPDLEKRLFHRPQYPAISAAKAAAIAEQWIKSQQLPDAIAGKAILFYLPDPSGVRLIYDVNTNRGSHVLIHALTGRVILPNI